jgi:hypothetical protein
LNATYDRLASDSAIATLRTICALFSIMAAACAKIAPLAGLIAQSPNDYANATERILSA